MTSLGEGQLPPYFSLLLPGKKIAAEQLVLFALRCCAVEPTE